MPITGKYAVVRCADSDDTAQAYGPFVSLESAQRFRDDYQEWVDPGNEYVVVELYPILGGRREIKDEKDREGL